MAVLDDLQRAELAAEGMRDRRLGTLANMLKADWRASVDAADTWLNSNAASFNSALPVTARNNLSTGQKALLLVFVITKRYLSGV